MDKGFTVPKWVLIIRPKIPQMPQNLSLQFVCPRPKVWDFNEKKLQVQIDRASSRFNWRNECIDLIKNDVLIWQPLFTKCCLHLLNSGLILLCISMFIRHPTSIKLKVVFSPIRSFQLSLNITILMCSVYLVSEK